MACEGTPIERRVILRLGMRPHVGRRVNMFASTATNRALAESRS